jgi:hypothetical protein
MYRLVDYGELPDIGLTFGATWADIDGDGRLDIFLSRHADKPEIYFDRKGLHFAKLPAEITLPTDLRDQHGAAACDYDRDGDWDLYITVGADRGKGLGYNRLWSLASPLVFHSVVPDGHLLANPSGRGRGAIWLELDGDGFPELLVLDYMSPPRLFRREEGRWIDWSKNVFLERILDSLHPNQDASYFTWICTALTADLDRDGYMDLFMAGEKRGLFWNDGTGRLVDVTAEAGDMILHENGLSAVAAGDVDNDGDLDLVCAHRRSGHLELWMNTGRPGRIFFTSGPQLSNLVEKLGTISSVNLADLDNDGHLDLYITQHLKTKNVPNVIARGLGDGRFGPAGVEWGAGAEHVAGLPTGAWPMDMDYDGDLDLLLTNGSENFSDRNGAVVLYENLTAYLGVTLLLETFQAPPHGLGAKVKLRLADQTLTRQVRCIANPWNATVPPVHFGVGSHDGPLEVCIEWSTNKSQTFTLPWAGAAYRLREGLDDVELVTDR